MSITQFTNNVNIIQTLADLPNDTGGLTALQLKTKFDEAAGLIKTYINTVLIPALEAIADGSSGADQIGATAVTDLDGVTVQAIIESLRNKLKSIVDGFSGADFIAATAIAGLTGGTVQALLEALKAYTDLKDTAQTTALTTHKTSSDHDGRYFTETELNAGQLDTRYFTETELQSIVDANSGADKVGATAITDLTGATVQTILESLRNALKSIVDGSSGADFVNSTAITGVTGTTVQSQLESIKLLIDAIYTKAQLDAGQLDNRYFTETELQSIVDSSSGADKIGATQITAGSGTQVQAILEWLYLQITNVTLGQIPDGSITDIKLATDIKVGSLAALTTTDKSNVVAAVNEVVTLKAPLASPALTGVPTAPTAAAGTNTTQLATTAFATAGLNTHIADYIRQPGYGTTAGVANTYTLDLTPNLASYVAGVAVSVKINVTNTGASTLNVDGLGVKSLKKSDGTDFSAGDLLLDSVYSFRYNGVNFIYQSESGVIINGQTEETIELAETISIYDPIYIDLVTMAKLADPATLPTGTGYEVAFSADGVYMTIAHAASPFVTIYKRSGDTFTKLTDPATLPTGIGNDVAFSADGVYMSVAHATSPYITIYKRSGDVFTKLADPATLPTGTGYGVAFSADGVYMTVAHNTSPNITIYKRSGDVFTKLANPATLPTGIGFSVAFSTDGVYMSVAHDITPFVTIYKRSGDVFTKLANPATLPTGTGYSISFSVDGMYMSVAHNASPYITIYKRSGDVFTKLADPATLPTGISLGVDFSTDGVYMTIAHAASPNITIYKRAGDTFTKIADPATLPTGTGNGVAFSEDGMYMTVAHDITPFVTIYKLTFKAFKSNLIREWATSSRLGYAKESGIAGNLKKVIITHR